MVDIALVPPASRIRLVITCLITAIRIQVDFGSVFEFPLRNRTFSGSIMFTRTPTKGKKEDGHEEPQLSPEKAKERADVRESRQEDKEDSVARRARWLSWGICRRA